jgi:hypothetical protein
VIDRPYDVGVRCEEAVSFDFFERLGDGFLAKRTPDFLQSIQFRCGLVLYEVNIGESPLIIGECVLDSSSTVAHTLSRTYLA